MQNTVLCEFVIENKFGGIEVVFDSPTKEGRKIVEGSSMNLLNK